MSPHPSVSCIQAAMVVFMIVMVHLTCWTEANQEPEYWTGDFGHGFNDFPWSMRHSRQSQIDPEYHHQLESVSGCSYNGARWSEGEEVSTRATCLRCRCSGGSLVCRLRVCPALPDPPPARCVLVLRKDACCAQLHCPDGGYNSNHIGRLESEGGDLVEAAPFGAGCIYQGTVYAEGSAMSSSSACEHCFCIGGRQRCVRPTCLPPPPGCRPRRAHRDQGLQACCPDYYQCEEPTTTPAHDTHKRGCQVNGHWFPEGEKVESETVPACDNCFCLKGIVRCLPMACAPPILGCTPVIRQGECCAHSYDCNGAAELNERVHDILMGVTDNFLTSVKNEDRSFHGGHIDTKIETTSPLQHREDSEDLNDNSEEEQDISITDSSTESTTQTASSTSAEEDYTDSDETSDSDEKIEDEITSTTDKVTLLTFTSTKMSKEVPTASTKINFDTTVPSTVTSTDTPDPESKNIENENYNFLDSETKVKIGINGTINCTAEISSSQISKEEEMFQKINKSHDDRYNDTEARTPSIDRTDEMDIDDYTYSPDEIIITNKLDISKNKTNATSLMIPKDNNMFMVNVSTFVRTNLSAVTLPPVAKLPPEIEALLNLTMRNKNDDYNEYDYSEHTLPPSLPNLKIIPFVAADAVLEEEAPKKEMQYPNIYPLEREDKFPTIFSSIAQPDNSSMFSISRDNMYHEPAFPVYNKDNYINNPTPFPVIQHDFDLSANIFDSGRNDVKITSQSPNIFEDYAGTSFTSLHNYHLPTIYTVPATELVTENPLLNVGTHDANLFSPPIETEGGFLPKEPLVMDEYYDVPYPSRPTSPHTTVSIQTAPVDFDSLKGCVSNNKQYDQGEILKKPDECMTCICFYGNFHCREQDCPYAKEGCRRLDTEEDKCCGRIVCSNEEKNTRSPNKVNTTLPNIELVTIAQGIDTPDPFGNVIRTEPAPNLQSIIDEMSLSNADSTMNIIKNNSLASDVSNVTKQEEKSVSINILHMFPTSAVNSSTFNLETVTDAKPETSTEKYKFTANYGYASTAPTTQNSTEDYDEDQEDDEEFSFGNVLKLLLSDSYDTKAALSNKNRTKVQFSTTTAASIINVATIPPFKPFSNNYIPFESLYPSLKQTDNTGTKSSFNKPTWIPQYLDKDTKPPKTTLNIMSTTIRYPTTQNQPTVTKKQEVTSTSVSSQQAFTTNDRKPYEAHKPPNLQHITQAPFAAGILKLAGCNIYGRMYRVGRIISELSTPCLQCMCTEAGVQCKQLSC